MSKVNKHGVKFSQKEIDLLRKEVAKAESKRRYWEKKDKETDLFFKGSPLGYSRYAHSMSKHRRESSFLYSKKSRNLNKFKSKKEYQLYMKNLKKINKKDYITKQHERQKKSYIANLKKAFGRASAKIRRELNSLTDREFNIFMQSELAVEYFWEQSKSHRAGLITYEEFKESIDTLFKGYNAFLERETNKGKHFGGKKNVKKPKQKTAKNNK